jgi:hypothetical protein
MAESIGASASPTDQQRLSLRQEQDATKSMVNRVMEKVRAFG